MRADHVHDDAEQIEHVLGDDVVRELERMLDDTTRDPHGRAIPGFADIHKPFAPGCPGAKRVREELVTDFIPAFEWQRVMVEPWKENLPTTFWIVLMGFLITAACGMIGNYLILRRMALVGDAISHSVLPGLAIAFLLSHSLNTLPMFIGALGAGHRDDGDDRVDTQENPA